MADTTKKYQIQQKLADGTLTLHPETEADIVTITAIDGVSATDVQGALEEIYEKAATGGVTGVKGNAESTYRTGDVNITAANIGLGNVNNTADSAKPVSTAQAAAIKVVQDALDTHTANTSNPHSVTKSQVGLGNVTNDAQVKRSEMGVASGVATLGTDGKIPSAQLPSYVDDVLEYTNQAAFPTTGETGKIYVDLATNKTYRWSGTAYVEISASLALGETSSTAYAGDKGKANADAIAALQTTAANLNTAITDEATARETADNNINTKISNIEDGTTVVGEALTARSATSLANERNFSITGDVTAAAIAFDGSADVALSATIGSGKVTETKLASNSVTTAKIKDANVTTAKIADGAVTTAKLANSGVTEGTYSAVSVNAKGIVTAGAQMIEVGATGVTTPSASLAVGGIFFKEIS